MQKIIGILFIYLVVQGCSIVNKHGKKNLELPNSVRNERSGENLNSLNITNEGFLILKAEVIVSGEGGSEKLLASIKFRSPDKYLVSIRSKTGIEATRIFISDDTILINDRINRNLYFGSTLFLRQKYGISTSLLPIIFGDIVSGNQEVLDRTECINGNIEFERIRSGIKINYILDCKNLKIVKAIIFNNLNEKAIELSYRDFVKENNKIFPGRIEIEDFQRKTKIGIKVKEIELTREGIIEFIPGNKYEHIELK